VRNGRTYKQIPTQLPPYICPEPVLAKESVSHTNIDRGDKCQKDSFFFRTHLVHDVYHRVDDLSLLRIAARENKNALLKPFIYKNDHFTKTGSGQS
jgi:hypothetical protein